MLHPAQSLAAPPAWPPTAQSQGTRACSVASPAHGCWVPPGRKQPDSCWGTAPLAEAEGFVPAPFFLSGQRPAFGARPSSARDFPASCHSRRGGASTRCHGFCPRGGESCSVRKAAPARGGDMGHGAGLRLRSVHPRALRFCPQARVGDPCRHRRVRAGCSSGPAAPGALQHQNDLPGSSRSLSLLIRSSSCGMEQEQELSGRWEGGAEHILGKGPVRSAEPCFQTGEEPAELGTRLAGAAGWKIPSCLCAGMENASALTVLLRETGQVEKQRGKQPDPSTAVPTRPTSSATAGQGLCSSLVLPNP